MIYVNEYLDIVLNDNLYIYYNKGLTEEEILLFKSSINIFQNY
jgi:hypothetical protein